MSPFDRFVERQFTGETYRPVYPIHNYSPGAGLAAHESRSSLQDSSSRPPTKTNEPGFPATVINHLPDKPIPQNSVAERDSPTKNLGSNSEVLVSNSPIEVADPITEESITHLSTKISKATDTNSIMDVESNSAQVLGPATMASQPAPVAAELGAFLFQMIGEATELTMLRTQKAAAEKDYCRRDAEFSRFKPNHDKFPAMEEAQRKTRDSAKKALASINEKCVTKDSALKEMVLRSATRLLPGLLGNSGQDKQKLQSQIDSLEEKCLNLEHQLQVQKSLSLEQREVFEATEKKNQTIQREINEELATAKDRYSQLDKDCLSTSKQLSDFEKEIRPRVEDAELKSLTNLREIGALKSDTRKDLSEMSDKISKDLEPRLDDVIKNLSATKAREESISNTTIREVLAKVADNTKNLGIFGQRLNKVETSMYGSDNHGGFDARLKLLGESLSGHLQTIEEANKNVDSRVQARDVVDLQTRMNLKVSDLGSNVEFTQLRKRVASVESQVRGMQKGFGEVEKRLYRLPSELAETSIGGEQLASLKTRVSTLEQARSATTANALDPHIVESLKEELKDFCDTTQSASDVEIGKLFDDQKENIKTIEKKVNDLLEKVNDLSKNVDQLSEKVIRATQSEQAYAGVSQKFNSRINDLAVGLQNARQQFNNSSDGLTTAVFNLENRMNNINTKDMGLFILSQMDSTYPNVRDAQNSLAEHDASLQRCNACLQEQDNLIKDLFGKIKALEDGSRRDLSDADTTQGLRRDVDELNGRIITTSRLAKEAKDAITALENRAEETDVLAEKVSKIDVRLGEVEDKISVSPATTVKSSSFSPAVENRTLSSTKGTSTIRHPKLDSRTPRQSSGEPLVKKRKLNGPASGANGLGSTRSNGVYSSSARAAGYRRKKAHTGESYFDGDDSEDVDFEPDQPTVSDVDDD
jgi:chromosome segregation ATPase